MLNSTDEARGTVGAIDYGYRLEPASEVADRSPRGRLTEVDVRSLPEGSELVVETRNSRYHFFMLDGSDSSALVQGGPYFRQETKVRINGSALHGSLLKIGWIAVGLFMEISEGGQRIVTSRVHSIRIARTLGCGIIPRDGLQQASDRDFRR